MFRASIEDTDTFDVINYSFVRGRYCPGDIVTMYIYVLLFNILTLLLLTREITDSNSASMQLFIQKAMLEEGKVSLVTSHVFISPF